MITERLQEPSPTCTVVICTHNRPAQLEQCLEAVARLNYRRFDVLVVDNAPSDDLAAQVAGRCGVRYVRELRPGLSRARNTGIQQSDSQITAFLDDDAIPDADWLSHLVGEFEDPRVMAVAGRILPLTLQTETEHIFASMGGFDYGARRRVVDRSTPQWFELANFGGIGGGSMAFRHEVFKEWPGFDARLGRGAPIAGGEEHHAFSNLIELGYRVVYTPDAVTRHPFPRSSAELRMRELRQFSSTTAYLTLLFIECSDHRADVLRYAFGALRGRRRAWREQVRSESLYTVSRARRILAYLSGPFHYLFGSRLGESAADPGWPVNRSSREAWTTGGTLSPAPAVSRVVAETVSSEGTHSAN